MHYFKLKITSASKQPARHKLISSHIQHCLMRHFRLILRTLKHELGLIRIGTLGFLWNMDEPKIIPVTFADGTTEFLNPTWPVGIGGLATLIPPFLPHGGNPRAKSAARRLHRFRVSAAVGHPSCASLSGGCLSSSQQTASIINTSKRHTLYV